MDINKEVQKLNKIQKELLQDIKEFKIRKNQDIETINSLIKRYNQTVWSLRKIMNKYRKEY